jgi:hypothetical protein
VSARYANPECWKQFDSHEGEFLRFHDGRPEGNADGKTHSVQHFWLCEGRRETYTRDTKNAESFSSASVSHRSTRMELPA